VTIKVSGNDANAFIETIRAVFAHDDIVVQGPGPTVAQNAEHQITILYKNKSIDLTDLQQATELKIQHFEYALIQASTADEKEKQNWNVADLSDRLTKAKYLQTQLNLIAQPQILKKMHFRSVSFPCTSAKIAEFQAEIVKFFGENIQIIGKPNNTAILTKAGKEISYSQFMDDVEVRKTALNEQLSQLQEHSENNANLIAETKTKITAANELAKKLREHLPLIGKIGFWKKNKITPTDLQNPQEFDAFSKALTEVSRNVGAVVTGTNTTLQLFQGNRQISLEEFKYLCQKQRDELQRQITLLEQKQKNDPSSNRLAELRVQHETITNTLGEVAKIKDTTSTINKVAYWCFKEFKVLFTLDTKISFKATSLTRNSTIATLRKLDSVFNQSIQLSDKAFFRDSVTVTEFGKTLSKEELCARVSDKIDQLRHQLLFSTEDTKKKAAADLKDLQEIRTLLTEKMSEHRAIKVYIGSILLLPLVLVALPSLLLKQAAHNATLAWKARSLDGRISYVGGKNFHSIADPDLRNRALTLKGTLNRNSPVGFAKAYRDLITLASGPGNERDLQIINDTIKSQGNYLLKLALRNGQPEAAKFLIQQGFFKNVSLIQEKKFSEIVKNRLSLNTTVLEELDKSPYMSPSQRADLYKTLYANSKDGASMGRIVNHLLALGQKDLAENIVFNELELLQHVNPPLSPEQKIRLNASQLLAAKIGTPKLLKAAFGIQEGDTVQAIKENPQVKASLFLPNTKCKTLLHFACEGSNPNFVLGVDQAMREFNNGSDNLKQELTSCLEQIPRFSKPYTEEEITISATLPYLKEVFGDWHAGNLSNKELKNILKNQLSNLSESPFDAKDIEGGKPIHKLNMSLAIELDKTAGVPHCFTSVVAYYNYVNAPPNKMVFASVLSVKLATCIGISFLDPFASQYGFLEKNLLFQPLTLTEVGIGAVIGLMVTKPYHRLMARHWQGFTQQHAAYEVKPENQLSSWDIKKKQMLGQAAERVVKNRDWDIKARLSSKGNPYTVNMGAGLTALRSHAVKDAIDRFKEIPTSPDSKPFKTDSSYASAVIEAYQEVIYGKGAEASAAELFDILFECFESVEDLKQLFNAHTKQGPNGIAFVVARLEEQINKAIANPNELSAGQYAACLLQAVELGRSDLKTKLWNLQNHRIAFESSQGWNLFGAILLTLSATAAYGADTAYATMAKEIFSDWEHANQIAAGAGSETILDPYSINLSDMSPQRAHAFDAVMGRNPQASNSYTDMILERDKKRDLELALDFTTVGAVKFVLDPAGLVIDLVADTARVGGGIVGGPVGAALAGGVTTFTLETIVIIAGFIGGLHSGRGIAEAWARSDTFWKRLDEKINQLPGSHDDHRKMKAVFGEAVRNQLMQAINTCFNAAAEGQGQEQQGQSIEEMQNNLNELRQNIDVIIADGFGPTTLGEISRAIVQADLTPEQRGAMIAAFQIDNSVHIAGLITPALIVFPGSRRNRL
jgi:hypothetical protein